MASNQFDTITIQGTTYKIPKAGTNPSWGVELNDYLKALGDALGTIVIPGDIQATTAVVSNNQSVAANVIGLSFDPSSVRSAFVDYSIFRSTVSGTKKEAGQITLIYDAGAAPGSKWSFTRESIDDAGVVFDITDLGQFTYKSDNMIGASYSGTADFRARVLIQS